MKNPRRWWIVFAMLMTVAGCDANPGPDSISSHGKYARGAVSGCNAVCHSPQSTIDPLATNGTGTAGKHVAHVNEMGIACETCHSGYASASTHMNGTLDANVVFFDSSNTTGTWNATTGSCSSLTCHGTDTLAWYGTDGTKYLDCSTCHAHAIRTRRQVFGAAGDFASNPSVTSHHAAGTSDPANSVCLVCHDHSAHTQGTVRLVDADTGTSTIYIYSSSAPTTLEPFCLSCHDSDGALVTNLSGTGFNPFNDGRTFGVVPYEAGDKIASYWTGTSVHRTNGLLTCAGTGAQNTGCHGRNGTINMHGSTMKGLLTNTMNFQIPLVTYAEYSSNPLGSYDYNNYKLCFDCHNNYPAVTPQVVLGYKQGGVFDKWYAPSPYSSPTTSIKSLFRDMYMDNSVTYPYPPYWGGLNQPYNDSMLLMYPYLALHNYHLLGFANDISDVQTNLLTWKYRGDAAQVGRITCTACHNVHGTSNPVRSIYNEMVITAATGTGPDEYKQFFDLSYELMIDTIMSSYPINCVATCHGYKGTSYYWYTPIPSGE